MNTTPTIDLASSLTGMVYEFVPYMLIAMTVSTNFRTGIVLMTDAIRGSRLRRDGLLGLTIVFLNGLLGWASYCSLILCAGRFMSGVSLAAEIQSITTGPVWLLKVANLSPWVLLGGMIVSALAVVALEGAWLREVPLGAVGGPGGRGRRWR